MNLNPDAVCVSSSDGPEGPVEHVQARKRPVAAGSSFQKRFDEERRLCCIRRRWGVIYDRERYTLLRAHGEELASGAADEATRLH